MHRVCLPLNLSSPIAPGAMNSGSIQDSILGGSAPGAPEEDTKKASALTQRRSRDPERNRREEAVDPGIDFSRSLSGAQQAVFGDLGSSMDSRPREETETAANTKAATDSFYKSTAESLQQRTQQRGNRGQLPDFTKLQAQLGLNESASQGRNATGRTRHPSMTGGVSIEDVLLQRRLSGFSGNQESASFLSASSHQQDHSGTLGSARQETGSVAPFPSLDSLQQLQQLGMSTLQGQGILGTGNLPVRIAGGYHQQLNNRSTGGIGSSLRTDQQFQTSFLTPTAFTPGNQLGGERDSEKRSTGLPHPLRSQFPLSSQHLQLSSLQSHQMGGLTREEAESRYRDRLGAAALSGLTSRAPLLGNPSGYVAPAQRHHAAGGESAAPFYNFPALDHGVDPMLAMQLPGSSSFAGMHNLASSGGAPLSSIESEARHLARQLAVLPTPAAGRPNVNPPRERGPMSGGEPSPKRPRVKSKNSQVIEDALVENSLVHHTQRTVLSLATSEDDNWLSEFMCFIRSDLAEVFQASEDDVRSRQNSKKVLLGQVGIRCRHCAHVPYEQRTSRSSCYPSSLSRIYQSLTMMIREHFANCRQMRPEVRARFIELKGLATQGAADSKHFWISAARAIGMRDTERNGIAMDNAARDIHLAGVGNMSSATAFGDGPGQDGPTGPERRLVDENDRQYISAFTFKLLEQTVKIKMKESERVGNRKTMEAGARGFACKFCHAHDRRGQCRFFPTRKRTLVEKVKKDLYEHLQRCILCPSDIQQELQQLRFQESGSESLSLEQQESEKLFYHRVWTRLMAPDDD